MRIVDDLRGSIDFHWLSKHARCEHVWIARRALGRGISRQRTDDDLSSSAKRVGDARSDRFDRRRHGRPKHFASWNHRNQVRPQPRSLVSMSHPATQRPPPTCQQPTWLLHKPTASTAVRSQRALAHLQHRKPRPRDTSRPDIRLVLKPRLPSQPVRQLQPRRIHHRLTPRLQASRLPQAVSRHTRPASRHRRPAAATRHPRPPARVDTLCQLIHLRSRQSRNPPHHNLLHQLQSMQQTRFRHPPQRRLIFRRRARHRQSPHPIHRLAIRRAIQTMVTPREAPEPQSAIHRAT